MLTYTYMAGPRSCPTDRWTRPRRCARSGRCRRRSCSPRESKYDCHLNDDTWVSVVCGMMLMIDLDYREHRQQNRLDVLRVHCHSWFKTCTRLTHKTHMSDVGHCICWHQLVLVMLWYAVVWWGVGQCDDTAHYFLPMCPRNHHCAMSFACTH